MKKSRKIRKTKSARRLWSCKPSASSATPLCACTTPASGEHSKNGTQWSALRNIWLNWSSVKFSITNTNLCTASRRASSNGRPCASTSNTASQPMRQREQAMTTTRWTITSVNCTRKARTNLKSKLLKWRMRALSWTLSWVIPLRPWSKEETIFTISPSSGTSSYSGRASSRDKRNSLVL